MTRVTGPDVVAAWGLLNGFLVGGLIGYGDNVIPIALYAGSALLIEFVALISWWVMRTHLDWASRSPSPYRTRRSVLAAAAVALVGAGIIWDWWMALPALYPLVAMFAPEGDS